MVLTIKNFESQHVGPGVVETAPTNLVGVAGVLKATLTWTSATGESGVTWTEENLVRKEGSAPQGSMDGTTVATITTKDTYKTTGYEDTGLDSTKTYYYKVFAVYDNGTEKGSTAVDVTPTAPTFTGLTFTAEQAGSQVQLNKNGNPTAVNLEISTNGADWSDYTIGTAINLANVGDKVYMRNKSTTDTGFSTNASNHYQFAMTGKIGASGDITSLLNKNGTTTLSNNCSQKLFYGCTNLTTAPSLPATTLANSCYNQMFNGCTSLTTLPELPATTLANYCYNQMFKGCTSLTTAPELPATTLANYCYYQMFNGCTSLTTLPELPATTLAIDCYSNMFYGCTSLTTAPELPATTLANSCYYAMFNGCTSLTTVPELSATTLAIDCYSNMFKGCTSLTTAPELPATTLANNCYSGMFRGCTSLTTVPELSATTLAEYCYYNMFRGCTGLTTVPELPATTLATRCYFNMFNGCTSLKVSTTQIGEYQIPYRIPSTGTGTSVFGALDDMFNDTGGTFKGTPSINTTYYLSNA